MEENFNEVLDILTDIKLIDFVVLIGSWAELIYEKNNLIEDFNSNIQTQDIDFLIKNIKHPREPVDVIAEFSNNGYDLDVTGFGIYKLIKGNFEVEFLAQMKGGNYNDISVPAFKLPKVEALTHINMLLNEPITTIYNGNNVTIPNPYNYVLHKMIINKDRKEKKAKDQRAIINLLLALDNSNDEEIFLLYFNLLSSKEKKEVKKYITSNNLEGYFDSSMHQ